MGGVAGMAATEQVAQGEQDGGPVEPVLGQTAAAAFTEGRAAGGQLGAARQGLVDGVDQPAAAGGDQAVDQRPLGGAVDRTGEQADRAGLCLLYTSPSPRDH
jgi:hypothetical protein